MSVSEKDKPRDALSTLRIRREDRRAANYQGGGLSRLAMPLVVVLLLGIGGYVGWMFLGGAASGEWIPDAVRSRPEVRATKAVLEVGRSADAVVVATGYIESFRQANIGARAAGRIESVLVEEGTPVTEGEVIAILDHKDIDAALAAAQASLKQAQAAVVENEVMIERYKKDLDRTSKLRNSSALSEAEHDQAYFQHRAAVAKKETLAAVVALAEARVQESEQFRENMFVRAPFDGTVISKDAEVGESILPGGMGEASGRGSVVTVADLKRLEVECDVKEDYIGRVRNGSPAEVAVDAVPGRRYSAKVRKVIPMGDRARATIKVKVAITDADERLFPEMSATVYFLPEAGESQTQADQRRVFVDAKAIVSAGDESFVWLLGDNLRPEKSPVRTGEEKDGRIEIMSGLSGGERVIVSPPENLRSGRPVKLRD